MKAKLFGRSAVIDFLRNVGEDGWTPLVLV